MLWTSRKRFQARFRDSVALMTVCVKESLFQNRLAKYLPAIKAYLGGLRFNYNLSSLLWLREGTADR